MLFLIDENLPLSLANVFRKRGFEVEHVGEHIDLRTKSDDVIFDYAVRKEAILVTRDLDFGKKVTFSIENPRGLLIIRFPNEILVSMLCKEVDQLTKDFEEKDFENLIILELGSIRLREL